MANENVNGLKIYSEAHKMSLGSGMKVCIKNVDNVTVQQCSLDD